ncbi:RING-type E3 ubiquitin transferase [Heracleum sosnowskyi]|uniref:U-box domain-containing protein n=1 Tax=Heracleum sosnowskyi TaxID=360622 RepID=A0AAD8N5B6_9APIA|nr:RING-type E3 ubiquitin transferase [Heracleum sosnowskyi]
MDELDVPTFFLCPISLEIMKDPVILSTGITYDRMSIEKWIFSGKNDTCPVTKQKLGDSELTPNHTLRRLIQSWCTLNASYGVERIPTPRPPISKSQLMKLLNDSKSPKLQMECLRKLKFIVSENETNKRCMEDAGASEILASIITSGSIVSSNGNEDGFELSRPDDEALDIMCHLQLSEKSLKSLNGEKGEFIESLMRLMQCDNYESRTYSVILLKSILKVADPLQKSGRNRIKAVEAGAVSVMIDFLCDHSSQRRVCEMVLVVLDQLCQCAEGRAELLNHGAGLAVVSKKILRVSQLASEKAVKIILSIAKFSATTPNVLQEMLHLGVVGKLCLVLQTECGEKIKDRAAEILKLHARAWKNTSCLPINLRTSYPS